MKSNKISQKTEKLKKKEKKNKETLSKREEHHVLSNKRTKARRHFKTRKRAIDKVILI
jgi:hypothetical protein